jgi:hypothetical protein
MIRMPSTRAAGAAVGSPYSAGRREGYGCGAGGAFTTRNDHLSGAKSCHGHAGPGMHRTETVTAPRRPATQAG